MKIRNAMTNLERYLERTTQRRHLSTRDHDLERGASLILALVFLIVISLVIIALVSWTGNSLRNTVTFQTSSALEYATSAAVQVESQNLRYSYQAATASPYNCTPGGGSTFTINDVSVSVYCSIVVNPHTGSTRVITMSSCGSAFSQSACVAKPFLQAVVEFNDYSFGGTFGCSSTSNQTTCGTAMAVDSWTII